MAKHIHVCYLLWYIFYYICIVRKERCEPMCFGGVCELHISPTNIVKQSLQHSFHILSRWLHGFIMVLYFSRCFGLKIHIFSRCLIWSACPWASSGTKTEKTKSGKILGFNLGHIFFFVFFVSGGGGAGAHFVLSKVGRPLFLFSGAEDLNFYVLVGVDLFL